MVVSVHLMQQSAHLESVEVQCLRKARSRLVSGTGLGDESNGGDSAGNISGGILDALGVTSLVCEGTGSRSSEAPAVDGLLGAEGRALGLTANG